MNDSRGSGGAGVAAVPAANARFAVASFNLAQAAAAYDLFTASGDVYVKALAAFVKTASGGLTSITIETTHTTPKSVVASINNASITLDLTLTVVTATFRLPSTKKITGTIVGTGNAGEIIVIAEWVPLTAGATLT